jgi:hypothetical protein
MRLAEQQAPAAAFGELCQVADRVDLAQWVRQRGDPDASQHLVGIDVAEFITVTCRRCPDRGVPVQRLISLVLRAPAHGGLTRARVRTRGLDLPADAERRWAVVSDPGIPLDVRLAKDGDARRYCLQQCARARLGCCVAANKEVIDTIGVAVRESSTLETEGSVGTLC